MKKPLIGIMMRCYQDQEGRNYQYVFDSIRRSIIQVGGEPFLLCPTGDINYYSTSYNDFPDFSDEERESIDYFLSLCDGLFLPGGCKFTKYDKYVVNLAIKKNIPILGVCLGMQILANINRDNELFLVESSITHLQDEKDLYCHEVDILEDSMLYRILQKKRIKVNSFHKMSTKANSSFKVSAKADDGIIEAIEMPSKDFVLGVQWHPEKMINYDDNSLKIMASFIEHSKQYKKNKEDILVGNR